MIIKEYDVNSPYGRIRIYRTGIGSKKLLLLHGGGCDSAMLSWKEVMERIDGHKYTVYAPDLLGYGKSNKPDGLCGDCFYPVHIDFVKELADRLGLDRFLLAGLSMGGAIAIGFALKFPERVQALFPVDTWGISEKLPLHALSDMLIHNTELTLMQYALLGKSRALTKASIAYSLIGSRDNITEELTDEVIAACSEDGAGKAMLDYQRSSCGKNGSIPYYADDLARLTMPVIFINGENDPLVPLKDARAAARRVKNGKVCILGGCKHWSVKERPNAFINIVNKYSGI